mmetsp:Transcript_10859/g.14535  ORF Transcript_10859/g.14535 Transcript_10859/m.14535 type:complete len:195 (+) Transcript_10859:1584-2168(+)
MRNHLVARLVNWISLNLSFNRSSSFFSRSSRTKYLRTEKPRAKIQNKNTLTIHTTTKDVVPIPKRRDNKEKRTPIDPQRIPRTWRVKTPSSSMNNSRGKDVNEPRDPQQNVEYQKRYIPPKKDWELRPEREPILAKKLKRKKKRLQKAVQIEGRKIKKRISRGTRFFSSSSSSLLSSSPLSPPLDALIFSSSFR